MGSTASGTALCIMVVCCDWCISIRLLFLCTMVSSGVRWFAVRRWLWCFLIVGIHASNISAPLSPFMLFGSTLAFFTFLVYQWLFRSINFISFHSGCVRFHYRVLKPRNSECVRVVCPCRVLLFFLAWVVPFLRCRLCRMRKKRIF